MCSVKITYLMDLTQKIRVACANGEGSKLLLHHVHGNFVKCINICIANDGKHIKDVISIEIRINRIAFYVFTYVSRLYGHPSMCSDFINTLYIYI